MSDKDLEKLAAAMKGISPSEASRARGMDAAMAAFSVEFPPEKSREKETADEKISAPTQGLANAARPTGQTPRNGRGETLGSILMAPFNKFFNSPKAMMMGGSCMAALLAAIVFLPNMNFTDMPPAPKSVTEKVIADNDLRRTDKPADPVEQQQPTAGNDTVAAPMTAPAPEAPPQSVVKPQSKAVSKRDSRVKIYNETAPQELKALDVEREAKVRFNQSRKLSSLTMAKPQFGGSNMPVSVSEPRTVAPQPGGYTLEEVPATFKTETKTIVTKEASTEIVTVPPVYDTIQEPVVVQEASTELVTIPPVYNDDGTIAVPAQTQERIIPSITKMQTRRVIKTPASTQERIVPAGTTKTVNVETKISPQRFYLRDDTGQIIRKFESRDAFEKYQSNLATSVEDTPVSTFSIDVDTASYSFLRSSVNRGQLPPRSAIRIEELINYFPYEYEAPRSADEPFKANVTVTQTPWNSDTKLMHIGIKGYVPAAAERPNSNIVFLIDTSGSMNQANKLPLLISSFKLLLKTLGEDDTVSIVTYAGSAGTVLEPTPANETGKINAALNSLRSGGSTAGAAGLELAYNKALESFDKDGNNRVILATDGDFNVGFSSPEKMKEFIEDKRDSGIFLSVLGFGNGNYKDDMMQSLAQNGNGVAAYIDTLAEANKVLANEAGSALMTIAKDVKIQVEFNPDTIAEYRLIGYETRALKRQDFNNDKIDAGEIGAGHSVTAIYEMTPVGSPAVTLDPLRYASERVKRSSGSDEYAFVKIRHKLPSADTSTLQTFPIGRTQERSLARSSDDMRFAAAVAAVGQKLRGDTPLDDYNYDDAIKLAASARGEDKHGYRSEFIQLARLIETLDDKD